jgi:hypothetical protein
MDPREYDQIKQYTTEKLLKEQAASQEASSQEPASETV